MTFYRSVVGVFLGERRVGIASYVSFIQDFEFDGPGQEGGTVEWSGAILPIGGQLQ